MNLVLKIRYAALAVTFAVAVSSSTATAEPVIGNSNLSSTTDLKQNMAVISAPAPPTVEVMQKQESESSTAPDAKVALPQARSVALVIAGGGLKTVGAIGVLKVLEREHVPISYIYGTSCGAVIGALYAAGMPVKDIEKMFVTGAWQRAVEHQFLVKAVGVSFTSVIPGLDKVKRPGVTAGTYYEKFLRAHLPKTFAELKTPFRAVAVDICSGENVCLKSGDLPRAVLASCALPPFVKPVEWGDGLLIDGGMRGNLPVDLVRQNNEGDIIIACSSAGTIHKKSKEYFRDIPRLNRRAVDILFHQTDTAAMNSSDILIEAENEGIPMMDKNPKRVKAAIDAGEVAAERQLRSIQQAMKQPAKHSNSHASMRAAVETL